MTGTNLPLLVTKTRFPRLPMDWVSRPRLVGAFAEAVRHRLVLLSAPAGYGKTTLLIEALRQGEKPVAWLSLDGGDNDPVTFLAYLLAALRNVVPEAGESVLRALQSPEPPPTSLLLTAIVNSLSSYEGEYVLVLDDYHVVESQTVHEALTFLVDRLPSGAHLVLASRSDPPLPLARWRVSGDLAEIRADALSFTVEEATAFFHHVGGVALAPPDVALLTGRTEGWIAALKMAALSLRGKSDPSAYVKAFSGSHHYIFDYLAQEVLSRQTPAVRQFLLETSGLERLCASLCDAVTGRSDSQSVLAHLESANLFLSPLDDERRWYRYHQLFATILQNQLGRLGPERSSLLHQRASAWYEREGFAEEAIDHSLSGGDPDRAADLLEKAAPRLLRPGRPLVVLGYLARLPEPVLESHPWLCVSFAWAALLSHQWDLLSKTLAWATAGYRADPQRLSPASRENLGRIEGHLLSIQGYIAQAQGDIARSIKVSESANRLLPADDLITRSANSINLAVDYLILGEVAEAVEHLEAAQAGSLQSGNAAVALSAQAYLAETEAVRLRFDRATELCRQTIEMGTQWGNASPLPYTALAFIVLGQIMYERNQLPEAARLLAEGMRLAEANHNWTFLLKSYLAMARLSQALGDTTAAVRYCGQAAEAAPRAPQARESRNVPAWQALLALRRGELAAASEWAAREEAALPLSQVPPYSQELHYLTLVRVKVERGEGRELPVYLDAFLANAERHGRPSAVVEALVLKALALDCLGERSQSLEALSRALALAEVAGYVRTFVDEGAPLATLLRRLIAGGQHSAYATRLLNAFPPDAALTPSVSAGRGAAPQPVEALSERELEVLRLIAAGASNKAIASTLFLALGTVKKHTSNIFGKLGVDSRTQALARARELGLI